MWLYVKPCSMGVKHQSILGHQSRPSKGLADKSNAGQEWKEKKSPKETAAGWNLLSSPCWRDPEGRAYTKGKPGNTIPQNTIQYKFKGPPWS